MEGFPGTAPRQPVIASMAADLPAVPYGLHRPCRSLCRLLRPVGCLDAHVVVFILGDLTVHGRCDHVPGSFSNSFPGCPADEVLGLHRLVLHRCVLRLPEPLSLLLMDGTPSSRVSAAVPGGAPGCIPSAAPAVFSKPGVPLSSAFPENLLTAFRFAFGGCPSLSLSSSPRVK